MIFTRHPQVSPDWPKDQRPPTCTWNYLKANKESRVFEHDLALVTCPAGHTCRIVSTVHAIAADGTLSPSYVCPVPGCTFHEFVVFEGWEA